eukprot:gene7442-582_t
MASRVLAQVLAAGAAVVFRAATQAWGQALQNAQKSGVANETVNAARKATGGLLSSEAHLILGVQTGAPWPDVMKRYKHLFEKNDKDGSFYLTSKVVRAKEALEAEYEADGRKTPEEEPAAPTGPPKELNGNDKKGPPKEARLAVRVASTQLPHSAPLEKHDSFYLVWGTSSELAVRVASTQLPHNTPLEKYGSFYLMWGTSSELADLQEGEKKGTGSELASMEAFTQLSHMAPAKNCRRVRRRGARRAVAVGIASTQLPEQLLEGEKGDTQ